MDFSKHSVPSVAAHASSSDFDPDVAYKDGLRVQVDYTGSFDDGTVFDTTEGKAPISFKLADGQMAPGFIQAVRGMRVGETTKVRLEPKDAYGERLADAIEEVPVNKLPAGIKVGARVQSGGFPANVLKIENDSATLDFNHPLAGKALTFSITLVGCSPPPELVVETLEPGDGETFPKVGDILVMHYVGTLAATGEKFDSSRDRGEPFQFTVGKGEVIQGWDQGVMKMTLGEKANLRIPSELGYGETGAGWEIPPYADLVFEVELLDIRKIPHRVWR